jgi:hypothetical protein
MSGSVSGSATVNIGRVRAAGVRGRRGHLPAARLVSVTDAPLTSPEFAEALRAFCEDVVAAQ